MAESVPIARSAFHGALHDHGVAARGVVVSDRDGVALASVLARKGEGDALRQTIRERYGIDLPDGPKRAGTGGLAFLGVGRGRWLAMRDIGSGGAFADELTATLGRHAAIIDQSDGYGVLRVTGSHLRETLAKGVAIDLHPLVFRVGDVAVTQIAHIGAILCRLDDGPDGALVLDVAVFRSMAGSFWHWLTTSAAEFGLVVEDVRRA